MSAFYPRREHLWFWGVAITLLFAGLGLRDPCPADDPRFALVAKQMVESGQWLFPMRGDELYPDKPPLLMWLQAVFLTLTGPDAVSDDDLHEEHPSDRSASA